MRALKPVEKIVVPAAMCTPSPLSGHCPLYHLLPKDQRAAKVLVAELRQDKPSWLRYVRTIEVRTDFGTGGVGPPQAIVETGIFLNETGREVGRTICESMLEREAADRVFVWGVVNSPSWMTSDTVRKSLAKCRAGR
jgi:hypothetical protein